MFVSASMQATDLDNLPSRLLRLPRPSKLRRYPAGERVATRLPLPDGVAEPAPQIKSPIAHFRELQRVTRASIADASLPSPAARSSLAYSSRFSTPKG